MEKKESAGAVYIIATAVFILLGVITLIPYAPAAEKNVLGYLSICPFAPVSTVICFFAAYTTDGIRNKKKRG